MTLSKRAFDIVVALMLAVPLLPVIGIVAALILLLDGRPVFYLSERMSTPDRGFQLVKFRTMRPEVRDHGVSGGNKSSRITALGSVLRKTRLDELPQLWNVLVGDISFVGPRPPLRQYVELFPDLYAHVLRSRPGITGLASVYFHAHEEKLLSDCRTAEETNLVYSRRCIPRKAQLDLIYQQNRSICYDVRIMLMTVFPKLR